MSISAPCFCHWHVPSHLGLTALRNCHLRCRMRCHVSSVTVAPTMNVACPAVCSTLLIATAALVQAAIATLCRLERLSQSTGVHASLRELSLKGHRLSAPPLHAPWRLPLAA